MVSHILVTELAVTCWRKLLCTNTTTERVSQCQIVTLSLISSLLNKKTRELTY